MLSPAVHCKVEAEASGVSLRGKLVWEGNQTLMHCALQVLLPVSDLCLTVYKLTGTSLQQQNAKKTQQWQVNGEVTAAVA